MESFFKMLKSSKRRDVDTKHRAQARPDVVDWAEGFYNRQRMHSSIGYRTRGDYETAHQAA